MGDTSAAVAALRAGDLVVLPTDTVYGLACAVSAPGPVRRLYALKGRRDVQPTALVAASLDALLAALPELQGEAAAVAKALLPGPYTLVVPNPAGRYPWLCGERPETIGVRVPALAGDARTVVEELGVVAATSANLAGGRDPCTLAEVPDEIRAGVAAAIDGGELPGVPSTVVDLTGDEVVVLRSGAVPAADVLARVDGVLRARRPA